MQGSSTRSASPVSDQDRPTPSRAVTDAYDPVEYCPVSIGAKVLGDRWSLLIVRELMVGTSRFNEIQRGLPGLSRSMLAGRLRQLEHHGLIARGEGAAGGYALTPAGEATRELIMALGRWTVDWKFPAPSPAAPDATLMLWRIFQGIRRDALPDRHVTVQFTLDDGDPRYGWLELERPRASLCFEPPKHDADLHVVATVATWQRVWFGHQTLAGAQRAGDLALTGPRELTAAFPRWLAISPFAADVAARARDARARV